MKNKTALIIAIFAAVLGVFLIMGFMAKVEEKAAFDKNLKTVVVAKKNIHQYSLITLDMVKIMQVPSKYMQPGSITHYKGLVDENDNPIFVTLVPIMEDEIILTTKLSLPGGAGLSTVIPKGKRAITVPVTSGVSSSGLLKPGNKIDLIATFGDKSVYLLQNLLVLSVGNNIIGEPDISGTRDTSLKDKVSGFLSKDSGTVTVAVTPQEALRISYSRGKCEYNVVLRNTIDDKIDNIPAVNSRNLLSSGFKSKQEDSIEIYKGTEMFKQWLK